MVRGCGLTFVSFENSNEFIRHGIDCIRNNSYGLSPEHEMCGPNASARNGRYHKDDVSYFQYIYHHALKLAPDFISEILYYKCSENPIWYHTIKLIRVRLELAIRSHPLPQFRFPMYVRYVLVCFRFDNSSTAGAFIHDDKIIFDVSGTFLITPYAQVFYSAVISQNPDYLQNMELIRVPIYEEGAEEK